MKNPIRKLLYLWLAVVGLALSFAFFEQVVFIRLIDALAPVGFACTLFTAFLAFLAGKESAQS